MKKRTPYIIKEEEITSIMGVLFTRGAASTYEQMRSRAVAAAEEEDNIDEIFLDMHDGMISRARELNQDVEKEKQLQTSYYTIASMLRFLAHEVHLIYIKKNGARKNSSKRFLHIVYNNPDAPTQNW